MKLSVIIPTYNRQELLQYTLDSLETSLHPGLTLEILAVDDGSTDGTIHMVEDKYPHVKLLSNEKKGAAAARNTGLKTATAPYVLYLDSDDLVGEGSLVGKVNFLESFSEYHACYGDYEYFNSPGVFSERNIIFQNKYQVPVVNEGVNPHLVNYLKGNYIPSNAIIWRKNFLIQLKGHDEALLINQDVDLFVRGLFMGLKIKYLPDATRVYIRHHEADVRVGTANNTAKAEQMLQLRKRFYQELIDTANTNKDYLQALSFCVFREWRTLRDLKSAIAPQFLKLSKKIHWPVEMEGSSVFRLIAKLFGPDNAVRTKYLLFRRNF